MAIVKLPLSRDRHPTSAENHPTSGSRLPCWTDNPVYCYLNSRPDPCDRYQPTNNSQNWGKLLDTVEAPNPAQPERLCSALSEPICEKL